MVITVKNMITGVRWGGKSMTALYCSLFSGVMVALQYDPAAPYYSASGLDVVLPFGRFWRSLHFYASQLFFLFSAFHLWAIVLQGQHQKLAPASWCKLVTALFVSLLLLFTGYILRGDITGSSAGIIAENILLSIPVLGEWLNALLFALSEAEMKRVYANHLVSLGLLWLVLSWEHIRHYSISWRQNAEVSLLLILFSVLFAAPMDPEQIGVFHIMGPWFFLGLQEMLRYLHPFWAGVVFPATLFGALLLLIFKGRVAHYAARFIMIWLLFYGILSLIPYLHS